MQQKKISSKDASNEISNLNKTVPVFEKKNKRNTRIQCENC